MKKLIFIISFLCLFSNLVKAQGWHNYYNDTSFVYVNPKFYDSISNELYFAGNFKTINGVNANNIIKWDGVNWYSLGNGFSKGGISKIIKYNSEIVAIGTFDSSGTTSFKMPIAHWNGIEWLPFDTITNVIHPLGGSQKPMISDVIEFNDSLYIIGQFLHQGPFPGTTTFSYFAKWDGTEWMPCTVSGGGVSNVINPLFELYKNDLFIAGAYSWDSCASTGLPKTFVQGLQKYDPVCRTIHQVGTWPNATIVQDMYVKDTSLYLGLYTGNPWLYNYITRYDGANFSPVGNGFNWVVEAISEYQGQLVAGGRFIEDGTNTQQLSHLAVWDGNTWNPLPGSCDLNNWVYELYGHDSLLFASGVFDSCGTAPVNRSLVYPNSITGLKKNSSYSNLIKVFPNPSNGLIEVFLESFQNLTHVNQKLEIIDYSGRVLQSIKVKNNQEKITINIYDLYSGIYILLLKENEVVIKTQKIILLK